MFEVCAGAFLSASSRPPPPAEPTLWSFFLFVMMFTAPPHPKDAAVNWVFATALSMEEGRLNFKH
jgi:hypothetical protein